MQAVENDFVVYDEHPTRGRSCGSCRLCCTLVPVELPGGTKPANTACQHLCSRGCRIYARRPDPCQMWSCRWLFDPGTADMRRPDRTGYIIDPMPDTLVANGKPVTMLQVWCDPHRRDAHRDPPLRAYLAEMAAKYRMAAIVRWGPDAGMVLVAPCLSTAGEWLELPGNMISQEDMQAKLRAAA